MKAAIIGSGVAGLTAAAHLSCVCHDVIIYEQFYEIGGCVNIISTTAKVVKKVR